MLAVDGIAVSFGGVRAVDGVTVEVADDEILGIIGPNGSGKTTFLNALTGLVRCKGAARLGGQPLDLRSPRRIRQAGLMRCFQAPQTFDALTVLENLLLSTPDRGGIGMATSVLRRRTMWRHERERIKAAEAILDRVGMASLAATIGSELTYGQRRVVELARAVAGRPRVLMLDEPSAGLNAAETEWLMAILRELRDGGLSLMIVDHKTDLINDLCDRVLVLEQGQQIALAPPAAVWADDRVVDAYLGRSHA